MLYLVTMESLEMGMLPAQQQVQMIEHLVIPSVEAMTKLEAEKKVLAGGVIAGTRNGVAIIEAASNEELGKLLLSLPFWGIAKVDVTPLESWESRLLLTRKSLEQLKATL